MSFLKIGEQAGTTDPVWGLVTVGREDIREW
jgi:hypothetical protein